MFLDWSWHGWYWSKGEGHDVSYIDTGIVHVVSGDVTVGLGDVGMDLGVILNYVGNQGLNEFFWICENSGPVLNSGDV